MSATAPAAVVRYTELAGRFDTYAVHAGPEPTPPLLGYVRHDADTGDWVARTTGSEVDAANIRRGFRDRFAAVSWLQRHACVLVAVLCVAPIASYALDLPRKSGELLVRKEDIHAPEAEAVHEGV